MALPGINLDLTDLFFILQQLRLPGNRPINSNEPTGIRSTRGVGNNVANPTWLSAQQPFTIDTYNAFTFNRPQAEAQALQVFTGAAQPYLYTVTTGGVVNRGWAAGRVNWSYGVGSFTVPYNAATGVIGREPSWNSSYVIDYSVRGTVIQDYRPRFISNTVVRQDNISVLQGLDDPRRAPGIRINPNTGTVNPLSNSGFFALLGQFYDHGLDFLHKGADGKVIVPILPGDPLYVPGAANYMTASRSNTNPDGSMTNTVAPAVDLSQDYGSSESHTVYLRDYDVLGNGNVVASGYLVGAADGVGVTADLATWADIKANALQLGLTLHDYNVEDVPVVRLNADGTVFLQGGNQAFFVTTNAAGVVVFVTDTARDVLAARGLTLLTTGAAFLDDMAPFALAGVTAPPGFPTQTAAGDNPAGYAATMQAIFTGGGFGTFNDVNIHVVAGDGRANENIGLTAIHDVFHKEHNRNVEKLIQDHGFIYNPNTGSYTGPDGAGGFTTWTGEEVFQAAKLVTENEYQHMIFAEFVRKISPNINAFAGYDITINGQISSEFANAVYRLGHSQLRDSIDRDGYNPVTGVRDGTNLDQTLLSAFLNPSEYHANEATIAGELAFGMASQVGNETDEFMTDVLRNAVVGAKLDLAALNIVRGRDSGLPSWNDTRADLFSQTGMTGLKPYQSWDEVGFNLLNPDVTLKNLIMAYATDAILLNFSGRLLTIDQWHAMQYNDPNSFKAYLNVAADGAMSDVTFMGSGPSGNKDFWNIDLWVGGLGEAKVAGGMLGSTFDAIFAAQSLKLQNADRFYYLNRLAGTNILLQIDGQMLSDIVMRNTGIKHLYSDILVAPDAAVEIGTVSVFPSLVALRAANQAGIVNGTLYGNLGNYYDARGVLNPNGAGNASEVLGGNDVANSINGAGGNDTVWGDGGNDTIEGGMGNDFLHGGLDNDILTDSQGDDRLWGDEGNDSINAGTGLDLLFGGDGNDTLLGGLGADAIDAGIGDDLIYGDNGTVDTNGNFDPLGDADVIDGGDGGDLIYGGGGDDIIDGGLGNDTIDGGLGANALVGLDGDDLFLNDPGQTGFGNSYDGGIGFDTVDYRASVGSQNAAGVFVGVTVDLSVAAIPLVPAAALVADAFLSVEQVIGTRFADTMTGGAAAGGAAGGVTAPQTDAAGLPILNPVTGLPVPMNFAFNGYLGNDSLDGGDGLDSLTGGAGADTLSGGLSADRFIFDSEVIAGVVDQVTDFTVLQGDRIVLDRNAFTRLNAGTVLNAVEFRTGAGITTANTAAQRIIYNTTNGDLFYDGDGTGTAYTATRFATLTNLAVLTTAQFIVQGPAPSTNQSIVGTNGNDTLNGGTSNDIIWGLNGNDRLSGNAGNDSLIGGNGNDTLNGGTGNDLFYFDNQPNPVTNLDILQDFEVGADNFVLLRNAFSALNKSSNTLTDAEFRKGAGFTQAVTAEQRIIYNTTGGGLFYDADGSGTAYSAVRFAVLANRANVSAADFLLQGDMVISGTAGNDNLVGGDYNDSISGLAGNDTLAGGFGNDTLVGGTGNDRFVFNTTPNAATNRDSITDFSVAQNDRVALSTATFRGFTPVVGNGTVTLAANQFRAGAGVTTANSATQRVLYNTTNGNLYYDADGTGATAAVQFATITNFATSGTITNNNFLLIA